MFGSSGVEIGGPWASEAHLRSWHREDPGVRVVRYVREDVVCELIAACEAAESTLHTVATLDVHSAVLATVNAVAYRLRSAIAKAKGGSDAR